MLRHMHIFCQAIIGIKLYLSSDLMSLNPIRTYSSLVLPWQPFLPANPMEAEHWEWRTMEREREREKESKRERGYC